MKIIYIHGFNSGYHPGGYKIASLQKIATVTGVSYDSFSMHDEVARSIRSQLEKLVDVDVDADAALAGTSLGGYWAARFGREFGVPALLVNPTIHPHRSLQRYVGHKLLNFVTRERNILRSDVPASYGDIERDGDFLVLLDQGDEVLDYREAERWFSGGSAASATAPAADHKCKIVTFEGGSHRFDHMDESHPKILDFLKHQPLSPCSKL